MTHDTGKPRILMLGDAPIYQLEQWNAFQQRVEIIAADLSSRETFIQSLRDNRCVAASFLALRRLPA